METVINEAIKALAEKSKAAPAHEVMHLTQAALNLAHTLQVKKQTEATK
jgi:hypothetical protein